MIEKRVEFRNKNILTSVQVYSCPHCGKTYIRKDKAQFCEDYCYINRNNKNHKYCEYNPIGKLFPCVNCGECKKIFT